GRGRRLPWGDAPLAEADDSRSAFDGLEAGRCRLEKLRTGRMGLGTAISFANPTVTEALCPLHDSVWIDTWPSLIEKDMTPRTRRAVTGESLTNDPRA